MTEWEPVGVDASISDVLRNAANYLAEYGWITSYYLDSVEAGRPRACVLGALAISIYGQPTNDPFNQWLLGYFELINVIKYFAGYLATIDHGISTRYLPRHRIAKWNDNRTDAQEVISTLRLAADRYDEQNN